MELDEILSLLEGAPQDEVRQKAMADALKRQRALGSLGVLTGDRAMGALGGQLMQGADKQEALAAGTRRSALERAIQAEKTRAYESSMADAADARRQGLTVRQQEMEARLPESRARAMKLEAEAERLRRKGTGKSEGKLLPATTVEGLAELPVAEKAVDDLVATFGRLKMGTTSAKASAGATRILGLQGTDAAEYNAASKLAMQAAGKILEGGKLAAGDEVKYAAMLPRPGDGPEVVAQKARGMKEFLRDLASRRSKGLKAAGYNVPEELIPSEPTTPDIPGAKLPGDPSIKPGDMVRLPSGEVVKVK